MLLNESNQGFPIAELSLHCPKKSYEFLVVFWGFLFSIYGGIAV
jgi:hypothetical protein